MKGDSLEGSANTHMYNPNILPLRRKYRFCLYLLITCKLFSRYSNLWFSKHVAHLFSKNLLETKG